MSYDLPDLQKKPSHNGISRLILSLRTGLTMKPAEDVVLILKNLACRLSTPSQWQLAKNNGFLELLATSLDHKNAEVHKCAFVIVNECILNLSKETSLDAALASIDWLLKLAQEYTESRVPDASSFEVYFKMIARLCASSRRLRDALLRAVRLSTLNQIDLVELSSEALTQLTVAIRAVASQGTHDSPLTPTLVPLMSRIAAVAQSSCAISTAMCETLSTVLVALANEKPLFLLKSSNLLEQLSKHVMATNCDSACPTAYAELAEILMLTDSNDSNYSKNLNDLNVSNCSQFFIEQYGLEVLRIILDEGCAEAVERACKILAKLLTGFSNQISLIVHYDLLSPLVVLTGDDDARVRKKALEALYVFMREANFGHWYQAVQLCFVASLKVPLLSPSAAVVVDAVQLCFVMMASAQSAEIDFYILQRLLHDGVHDIFTLLMFDEDETVCALSRRFFDRYFRQEYVEEDCAEESSF